MRYKKSFFHVIETIKENELDDVYNAHEWQKIRDGENTNWDGELDILSDYKHQVNECLQLLNDGTIEQMLTENIKCKNKTHNFFIKYSSFF